MNCLTQRYFTALKKQKILIEQWRKHYNEVRPHSSLGYRPPAPVANISGDKRKDYEGVWNTTH